MSEQKKNQNVNPDTEELTEEGCQAFLKMSQKIFKIGPDGFGAYLL